MPTPILYAELQVAGKQVPCIYVSYSLYQVIDELGRPSSDVRVGRLKVVLTGEPVGWSLWEEIKFDSFRRLSGHVLFFENEGQTAKRYTFYDATLVDLSFHYDGRGTAGKASATRIELYFSPATIEVNGQRIEVHSLIPWDTSSETSFRALTKPADPLPSAHLRAQPSLAATAEATDFMRFGKEKKPLSERPQSTKTGYLGSPKLTKPQLASLAKVSEEKYGVPVQVVKPAEMALLAGKPDARALFRTELDSTTGQRTATIYVQKGATAYELTHEMMHAKQYHQLGFEAYWKQQTQLQREEYVFEELMKNKQQWSAAEINHATRYIYYVKNGCWPA